MRVDADNVVALWLLLSSLSLSLNIIAVINIIVIFYIMFIISNHIIIGINIIDINIFSKIIIIVIAIIRSIGYQH